MPVLITDKLLKATDKRETYSDTKQKGFVLRTTPKGTFSFFYQRLNQKTGKPGYTGITSPGNAPSALTVGATDTKNTVTRDDGSWIDKGGAWIGPTQDRIHALMEEFGVTSFKTNPNFSGLTNFSGGNDGAAFSASAGVGLQLTPQISIEGSVGWTQAPSGTFR